VEVRTSHTSGLSDESDGLSARNSVANSNERLAEVEVAGHKTGAMVDVHHVSREEEILDEGDDAAIGSAHGIADGATKVDAEMPTRYLTIE
jgi:hypothetical protein